MRARGLCAVFAALIAGLVHCATPGDDRVTILPPDRASFTPVGHLLERRCGTLDCHGVTQRSLKLYGYDGLRLDAKDVAGGEPTTEAELDQSYRSIISLEPELLNIVVHDHGAQPERLTLVRKARGSERHKGLSVFAPGDDQDVCVTSWLSGTVSTDACARALTMP